MTAKEKAEELHNGFMKVQVPYEDHMSGTMESCGMEWDIAKQCAIIAVEELIKAFSDDESDRFNYWSNVKLEIEKL